MFTQPRFAIAPRATANGLLLIISVVGIVVVTRAALAQVPPDGLAINVLLAGGLEYTRQPLPSALVVSVGWSLALAATAFLIAAVVGTLGGLLGALSASGLVRSTVWLIGTAGVALPSFLWAMLLQLAVVVIYLKTRTLLLPSSGAGLDEHLILPSIALATRPLAYVLRVTVAAVEEQRHAAFMQVARSKGLSEWTLTVRHLLPVIRPTLMSGLAYAARLTVSSLLIIEYVFNWPGAGSAFIQAVAVGQVALATWIAVVFIGLLAGISALARVAARAPAERAF
jgi:ABC-type dipeptide/oligopeptide/nickel transport system permease component